MSIEFNSIGAIHDVLASQADEFPPEKLFDFLKTNHRNAKNNNGYVIPGSENDYHNLSVEFARQNCGLFAAETADYGVEIFPMSTDLLADKIKYYQEIGYIEKCSEAINQLNGVDKQYWTWRTFVFVIDYLKDTLSMVSTMDVFKTNLSIAENLILEFRSVIPDDERSYMAEAELKIIQNDISNAIEILKKGVENVNIAPQCCLKLADLYLEAGDFSNTVQYAKRGIVATAQDQPTVSIAYLYYLLALSLDAHRQAMFMQEGQDDKSNLQKIIQSYELADKLFVLEGRPGVNYRRTIEQKLLILKIEENIE